VKKKPKYNQNSVIRGALRRAFARSPLVQEVMNESRREVPRYKQDGTRHKKNWVQRQCEVCGNWESSSKMAVDHIDPVVSVNEGFQDWNEFISRLWCERKNLQRICDTCHDKKTAEERTARLLKQYTEELDAIVSELAQTADNKAIKKKLTKYIAKKKTVGLEPIVQRALSIRNLL
jgi:5-methylcytosine-specific restriction endonuclease McrA